jgi:hypothetical protein
MGLYTKFEPFTSIISLKHGLGVVSGSFYTTIAMALYNDVNFAKAI